MEIEETRIESQCGHKHCTCPVAEGETYCSPYCANDPPETPCVCGHAKCMTGLGARTRKDEIHLTGE